MLKVSTTTLNTLNIEMKRLEMGTETPVSMVCEPGNVRQFNAALRVQLPEAHDLAKALHGLGMMSGLRGARLSSIEEADACRAATSDARVAPSPSHAATAASLARWYADAGLTAKKGGC